MLGVVDLHGRAGTETGAAADALGLIHHERALAVDNGGANGRNRAAGHSLRQFTDGREVVVVDARRTGVLDDDGDVSLAAAVDGTAGGRKPHLVGHLHILELFIDRVHHRLDDSRRIGRGNIAVQPALGMGDGGDAHAGAADRKSHRLKLPDHRLHVLLVRREELDVVAHRKTKESVAVLVGNLAKPAEHVDGVLAGSSRPDRPDGVSALCDVLQHTRLGDFMVFPLSVILPDYGMQSLLVAMGSGLYGLPRSFLTAHAVSCMLGVPAGWTERHFGE